MNTRWINGCLNMIPVRSGFWKVPLVPFSHSRTNHLHDSGCFHWKYYPLILRRAYHMVTYQYSETFVQIYACTATLPLAFLLSKHISNQIRLLRTGEAQRLSRSLSVSSLHDIVPAFFRVRTFWSQLRSGCAWLPVNFHWYLTWKICGAVHFKNVEVC